MNTYWVATIVLALAALTPHVVAKRDFVLRIHNVTCKDFSHMLDYHNCSMGTIKKNRITHTTVNVFFRLKENYYPKNVQIISNLLINGKWQNLNNFTMDACELFKKSVNMPLIKIFTNQLKDSRKSNLIACPLYKNTLYYWKNLYIDPDWLPPYTPMMKTETFVNILQDKEIIATVKGYSEIRKEKNQKENMNDY